VPAGSDALGALGARLGFPFRDAALLEEALTHSSYANEHPGTRDNGALAFLGDAVLGLVVGEHLWRLHPGASEGTLTPKRAELVSGSNLARWAAEIELGTVLRVGRGEAQTGGREKESVLATAFEAVLAVIYLEGGLEAARRTVAARALW
jgi:ribonuclease III